MVALAEKFKVSLVPAVRTYIRYSPLSAGKLALYRKFFYLPQSFRAKTALGYEIAGNTADLVQRYVYYFGVWEPSLTAFIRQRLASAGERVFVDIGAHFGYYSLLAASCLPRGSVVAFEALPDNYRLLAHNIELNGSSNIRAEQCAVADVARPRAIFRGPEHNAGRATIRAGQFDTESFAVRGAPLTDLLAEDEIRATRLIKIDVEGAEALVLKGVFALLKRMPEDVEVVVEIAPDLLEAEAIATIFATFEQMGFFPYALDNGSAEPSYYVSGRVARRAERLHELPAALADVVFSRIRSAALDLDRPPLPSTAHLRRSRGAAATPR